MAAVVREKYRVGRHGGMAAAARRCIIERKSNALVSTNQKEKSEKRD